MTRLLLEQTSVQLEEWLSEMGQPMPSLTDLIEESVFGQSCSELTDLPMTATDILYNLGFAATDEASQVPARFLGNTNANLGDWNGRVYWADQTTPISNFDYLFNMMDDTPAMEEEVVDESMTDTSFKSAFTNSRGDSTGSCSSFESSSPHGWAGSSSSRSNNTSARPKMIRSHSLPEDSTSSPDKPFNKMKLKRHRSQLCLQQSFDTITEEEEDWNKDKAEKLETIKGSFSQSLDSVAQCTAVVKPSTQCHVSSYAKFDEQAEPPAITDSSDVLEVYAEAVTSVSDKKSAKLKRQNCEEIFQDATETLKWEDLKCRLEDVERKAWNTLRDRRRSQEKRKRFSKLRGTISLPAYGCQRIQPRRLRRCVTLFAEETETDTSESHSEISIPTTTQSIEKQNYLTEEEYADFPENTKFAHLGSSIPITESDYDNVTITTTLDSDGAWFAPAITIEQFVTDSSVDEPDIGGTENLLSLPFFPDRPLSPALSNASEVTLTPEEDEPEKKETKPEESTARKQTQQPRLMKMRSSVLFSSLNESYKSPFYIYTPKLRYRKRSSSLPLLYRPAFVRSKLRRAVTDSPHALSNIIEEYDADLDDEDLLCEQKEWEGRIYRNILRSITSSTNAEDLLKRIEDRVEGTSDEALKVKKSNRRKKTSFSKSGDEEVLSSSANEDKADHLAVKPRRKRRKSRERRPDSSEHLTPSPCVSPYELPSDHNSIRSMESTEQPVSLGYPTCPRVVSPVSPGSIQEHTPPFLTDSTEIIATDTSLERISDIMRDDTRMGEEDGGLSEESNSNNPQSDQETDRTEWEIKVLRDVIEHFEKDYAKSEKVLEGKRNRDKQIRMEIKMLKTQIAVYKMEKRMLEDSATFLPCSTSTPRHAPDNARHADLNSTKDSSAITDISDQSLSKPRHKNSLNYFLLNKSSFIERL